jgi:aminoglycoside 6-adenylyltransferase
MVGDIMRSEQQMMDLIINTAKNDDRVRGVIMGGSRANPNVKKDIFQDFDIIYAVRDIDTFTSDHSWINIFGEIMILQMPKYMEMPAEIDDGSFIYLMQFADGNRIDLNLIPIEMIDKAINNESLSMLLLDKDNVIGPISPASDSDFIIKKPTETLFKNCCNEFWWICPYVAKGIWRDELPYAMYTFNWYARNMLTEMTKWYIGVNTDFSISSGKYGKYFKEYLEPELWDMYVKSYSDSNYENLWEALFIAGDLFRVMAQKVSEHFGFEYPYGDDERVTAHLKHVKDLPRDAVEIYG